MNIFKSEPGGESLLSSKLLDNLSDPDNRKTHTHKTLNLKHGLGTLNSFAWPLMVDI